MPDQSPSDRFKAPAERFKAEMPQVPGVTAPGAHSAASGGSAIKLGLGALAVLLVVFLGARWALRQGRAVPKAADQQPQIELPTPAPDPSTLVPHATDAAPGIADVEEMAKPWSSKEFFIRNTVTGENTPALLVRLATGSASQASGYWAFSLNAPFGNCRLEYISDLAKLKNDYDFAAAKHPMVGNPCSRTVFDPLRMTNLPGTGALVRGAIAQGSDLRPPLGIEIQVRGKDIQAIRTE
jgi:hypothetical protein